MENLDSNYIETENAGLESEAKSYILETAKWGRFLSIVGFIFIGLIVVVAFMAGSIFSMMSTISPEAGALAGSAGAAFTVIYLLLAVFWFFPTWYLFRFSLQAIKALRDSSGSLTDAFRNLKSAFKFFGIFTIVILSFYGVIILIALATIAGR